MKEIIKPGYKKTAVGIIPEEWEVKEISNIGSVITGSTPKTSVSEYYNGTELFVSPSDIQGNTYVKKTEKTLSELGIKQGRIIPKNSILFVCIGSTIGKVTISGKKLITNQQINSIIPNKKIHYYFLFNILKHRARRIKLLAANQAVPILNKTEFSKIKLPIPPLPEQKAIADCLSTWDRGIEKLAALIDAKKEQKKGLMQRLLTGSLRLRSATGEPFDGEWKKMIVNELADVYDGTHQTPNYVDEGIPFYSVEHLTADNFENTKFISNEVFQKENKRVKLEKGDVLMTRIGDIGTSKYVDWKVNASFYVTLVVFKKKIKDIDFRFFHYFISSDFFQKELYRNTLHVAFPKKINLGDIRLCNVLLPPSEEQTAIAQVLTTADREIELLEQKLEAMKEQKKGLMQVLLTGEKRLV